MDWRQRLAVGDQLEATVVVLVSRERQDAEQWLPGWTRGCRGHKHWASSCPSGFSLSVHSPPLPKFPPPVSASTSRSHLLSHGFPTRLKVYYSSIVLLSGGITTLNLLSRAIFSYSLFKNPQRTEVWNTLHSSTQNLGPVGTIQYTLDKKWHIEGKELRDMGHGHTEGVTCQGRGPPFRVDAAPLPLLPEWEASMWHSWPSKMSTRTSL